MKLVIYKTCDGYAVTPRNNYYAYVQNARLVNRFPGMSEQEIIDYMCQYCRCTVDDFEHPMY